MNTRKDVNGLFLIVILLSLLAEVFVSVISIKGISLPIIPNLLISQMIIGLPGLIFFVVKNKETQQYRPYKSINVLSVFLLIIFAELMIPLVTAANVFSQLFTDNRILSLSGSLVELPMWAAFLVIGIIGPFCEEFVFRGIIYNGLKGRGERYIASAVISALFFGLMHMNVNQFCYAFVLGIVFAIVNEILDSTWPSFICHALINSQNVVLMYSTEKANNIVSDASVLDTYNKMREAGALFTVIMLVAFIILLVVSVFTTALAVFLLYGIAAIEGKTDRFRMVLGSFRKKNNATAVPDEGIYIQNDDGIEEAYAVEGVYKTEVEKTKKGKTKLLYPTGIIAISICLFIMFLLEPIVNILK